MNTYDPRRNSRLSRARDRQHAREARRNEAMAVPREEKVAPALEREPVGMTAQSRIDTEALKKRANLVVQDALWYARHRPSVWRWGGLIGVALILLFLGSYLLPGRIFPNVFALGVPLGGLTVDEAVAALQDAWTNDVKVRLVVQGETIEELSPQQVGLQVDFTHMAEAARGVGLSGIPLGYGIQPQVTLDYRTAEDLLVARAVALNTPAQNASYTLKAGIVVGVPGTTGRQIDITQTLSQINDAPESILRRGQIEIVTLPVEPDYPDPEPFLIEARRMASQPFQLIGYDPFTDTTTTWATPPENLVTWLEVGENGLTVSEQEIVRFLEALNTEIASIDPAMYISRDDAVRALSEALQIGERRAWLRVSHYPQRYTIQRGDSGYAISRRTGIPYFMIQEANAGRDLGMIYPGDEINLPSKDAVVPLPPVPTKRIVVDINTQMLYGFENGQEAFSWPISTGIAKYPTAPGVYQILNHVELAYGSSIDLCTSDSSCGQWKMYWFMGMYEVSTGLMNGFHGQVELPNGAYLGGGNVGQPFTYGCVMSRPEEAEFLYNWAEDGVVVEVISNDFLPTSDVGRQVLAKRGGSA
ncbi:MAG: L,D-transpeptidase family protein [Anaerolineae bacterium]|nr:L,D-transpeptidase family protein [Anaerolineae bacterium]